MRWGRCFSSLLGKDWPLVNLPGLATAASSPLGWDRARGKAKERQKPDCQALNLSRVCPFTSMESRMKPGKTRQSLKGIVGRWRFPISAEGKEARNSSEHHKVGKEFTSPDALSLRLGQEISFSLFLCLSLETGS